MPADDPQQEQLDAIAESFSNALRRGDRPSIDAIVAKYNQRFPELRSLLESILMIEGLKSSTHPPATSESTVGWDQLDQLDEYKILRQIGRGGMGVVFEAIHQPLSRRVAIKVLATRTLDETKEVQRFRREARAAARLRHSNIVPVFGVGHACNHHYYVMDYIDGISLRDWIENQHAGHRRDADPPTIDDRIDQTAGSFVLNESRPDSSIEATSDNRNIHSPQFHRWIARQGESVCDALHYAHQQGVLHRDIKPANLLIDRKDQIWIADFGLAKLSENQEITRTGDLVGTPQYMAPESLTGTYDERSEVYGTGLTLYELLTGQPAIEGRTTAEVIRNATTGVSTSPRKINPSIPRDLETIVLKSLAHEPSLRYQTAAAMRDDLSMFLSNRPINARRISPIERLVRWSNREPAAAAMTFATFFLLLALAVVSALGYWRTRESLSIANAAGESARQSLQQRTEALELAESQRIRAQGNLNVALNAFDQIMQNIADRGVHAEADFLGEITDRTTPNVTPDDARLLQSLLGFFDELATNNSEDLLAEAALAARRTGDVYASLGQLAAADRAYTEAMSRYKRVTDDGQQDPSSILAQAEIMNELAAILTLRGQVGRGIELFAQTVVTLESSDAVLNSNEGAFQYAREHRIYASMSHRVGLNESFTQHRSATYRFKTSPMGAMLRLRSEDELAAANEAIKTLERLVEEESGEPKFLAELARSYRIKSRVSLRTNKRLESERAILKSVEIFEELLRDHPESDDIRYELAMTLSSAEAFGWNQMRRARRSVELSSALLKDHPDQNRYLA
ncbi:MAG: serine/threonine-protein kinase, partial [Planctomycetota bacterium]